MTGAEGEYFSRAAKSLFPFLFWCTISILVLVDQKQNLTVKKKRKKKGSLPISYILQSISIFTFPSFNNFYISSFLFPFPLPSIFWVSKIVLLTSVWWGTLPPTCYTTALWLHYFVLIICSWRTCPMATFHVFHLQ